MPVNKGYGWKPSLPDIRDHKLRFDRAGTLPASVDLRETGYLPDIWDQGQLGSCVPHGVDAAYAFELAKQGVLKNWNGSRLFIYFNGRVREGTVNEDSGLTITDGIKVLNQFGTAPAEDWPYNIDQFTQKPPQKAFDDGKLHESIKYAQVAQTSNDMKSCLFVGVPFVIGFTVYDSFESNATASNGVVTLPTRTESVLGGHCILAVGYLSGADLITKLRAKGLSTVGVDPAVTYYVMRNSWGVGWGDAGYCYMPEAYLTNSNLSGDFWTVQSVSSPSPAPPAPDPTPVPVPTPGPPVVVDGADTALWVATNEWSHRKHIKGNKDAANAVLAWADKKGLAFN